MHSFIITGADKEKRDAFIQNECTRQSIKSFDIVTLSLENNTIGIEDIRGFQKTLLLVPYASPFTIGIIHDSDHLTQEAQQALLKTLEEPPPHVILYLESENTESLLPTIRSRCQYIQVASVKQTKSVNEAASQQLQNLLEASFASRAHMVDDIATTRDTAILFTQNAILSASTQMKETKTRKQGKILLQLLFQARQELEANVTPKLVMDMLFIKFQERIKAGAVSQIREG